MVYQFNQIILDTARYCLCLSDEPISVEPQVFDLLLYLIENRDRVVTRDELLESLWKGKVVTDAALGSRLRDARKVIKDSGTKQEVIKTIHGRGYQFVAEVIEFSAASSPKGKEVVSPQETLPLPNKPSIAVLPFANMSTEPEQEFFADGMAEDIIVALSQISALSVVARNSSFAYKDRAVKVQEIGSDLGVGYILEGSVRKSGTRARITAQLIDARNGHHLWAERYDRELDDVFEVQDEITRNVAIALQVELSFGEHARIWQSGTRSFEAWQCQIRGVQEFYKFTPEGRREAQECFEKAVSIDPEYLPAWAALGQTLSQTARFGDSPDSASILERVEQISKKLLEHEHSRANGYALQGNLRLLEGQHGLAMKAARQAVELAPDSPHHRGRLALLLVYSGEPEEALKQFRITTQQSPHYPNWLTTVPVLAHYLLGDLERAREAAEQSLVRFPDFPYANVNLAGIYSALGLQAEAHDTTTKLLRMQPTFSLADYKKSQLFINREDTDTWIGHLSEAGLPD